MANIYAECEAFMNYFTHKVSSLLSEGKNNVIKTVKKGLTNIEIWLI